MSPGTSRFDSGTAAFSRDLIRRLSAINITEFQSRSINLDRACRAAPRRQTAGPVACTSRSKSEKSVSEPYVDQIGAFQYQGRTIEAHVVRPGRGESRSGELKGKKTGPVWEVMIDGERFGAFPASPDDTAESVRERIKRWVDEHR
jgi:hypothetical protein